MTVNSFNLSHLYPQTHTHVYVYTLTCAVAGGEIGENRRSNGVRDLYMYLLPVTGPLDQSVKQDELLTLTHPQTHADFLWLRGLRSVPLTQHEAGLGYMES